MQGMRNRGEINIFREIRSVMQKEGLDIFINNTNKGMSDRYVTDEKLIDRALSIWGQDRKAFVVNKHGKQLLCNSKEAVMPQEALGELSDFKINAATYMPRGGDYYIGYKKDGEKWLLCNGYSIYDRKAFARFKDNPTYDILTEIFDVKPENIHKINIFGEDLDEVVRPIGYPYILVNDYYKSLLNLDEMLKAYPKNFYLYSQLQTHLIKQLKNAPKSAEEICKELESCGFKPIPIGGRYHDDINFINAIAFKNKKDKITYISNSTNKTDLELKFLEQLFDRDLRRSVPQVSDTYYISGGARNFDEMKKGALSLYERGVFNRNVIMDILANRYGGIHCMAAEIPKF